jgi:predicted nucleic-acid-binding Zn-ribbon protein
MAQTICPKCGGTIFELATISPRAANFKFRVIQCVSCGTPIPTTEYLNLGDLLQEVIERLERIEKKQ